MSGLKREKNGKLTNMQQTGVNALDIIALIDMCVISHMPLFLSSVVATLSTEFVPHSRRERRRRCVEFRGNSLTEYWRTEANRRRSGAFPRRSSGAISDYCHRCVIRGHGRKWEGRARTNEYASAKVFRGDSCPL